MRSRSSCCSSLGSRRARSPARPGERGYPALVALFGEWREAQKPRIMAGVPDYTPAAIDAPAAAARRVRARLAAIDPTASRPRSRSTGAGPGRDERPRVRPPRAAALVAQPGLLHGDRRAERHAGARGAAIEGAIELWRLAFPLPAAEAGAPGCSSGDPAVLEQAAPTWSRTPGICGASGSGAEEQAEVLAAFARGWPAPPGAGAGRRAGPAGRGRVPRLARDQACRRSKAAPASASRTTTGT